MGWDLLATFDAYNSSGDPDEPAAQRTDGVEFEWSCGLLTGSGTEQLKRTIQS